MAEPLRYSPVLMMVTILAVVAGAAAGLLGVGSPASPPLSFGGNYHTVLPMFVVYVLLASPLIGLAGVLALSLVGIGGDVANVRPTLIVLGIVAMFLLAVVLLIHPAAPSASTALGGLGAPGGGSGPGSSGAGGDKNNSSGGPGPGGGGGPTNGTGNNTTGNTSHGGGGSGGGSNSSNNTTHGGSGGGGSGGGSGNGSNRWNNTTPILDNSPPPSEPRWAIFVVAAIAVGIGATMLVPRLAARPRRARTAPVNPVVDPRSAVASVLSEAAAKLTEENDPRSTIGRLYRDLLSHLEPLMSGAVHRTPEEVRDLHLLPLGVRPVAAEHLTRLFEEASYSSHPLGAEDVSRAHDALRMAEIDLRAARGPA